MNSKTQKLLDFLNQMQKTLSPKENNDKSGYIKIKNFCSLLDTVRESKDTHKVRKHIYIHIPIKYLHLECIFLQTLQIDKKNITSKRGKRSKQFLYKAEYLNSQ